MQTAEAGIITKCQDIKKIKAICNENRKIYNKRNENCVETGVNVCERIVKRQPEVLSIKTRVGDYLISYYVSVMLSVIYPKIYFTFYTLK